MFPVSVQQLMRKKGLFCSLDTHYYLLFSFCFSDLAPRFEVEI